MYMSDRELIDLKAIMLLSGFTSYKTDYFDTNSYKSFRSTMLDNLPYGDLERFEFDLYPKSEILKSGKYVINKHFGKLDLRAKYADGDDMESQLVSLFGLDPSPGKYNEIIDYINNQIQLVRVTDIPVTLNCEAAPGGFVGTTYFYDSNIMSDNYLKKLPQCVREIVLSGNCDEAMKCVYVHEMAHALINRHKGSIENFLNSEVFPIFMEKVAALDIDESGYLLDLKNLYRIIQLKHMMLDNEVLEFSERGFSNALEDKKYILSTLHATALFDT